MIDSFSNLLFRCSHRRLTSPVTPVSKEGKPHRDTYVVGLDCGKQFRYDLSEMRVGKPLPISEDIGVLPSGMARHRTSRLKVAAIASVLPIGIALGSLLTSKRRPKRETGEADTERKQGLTSINSI